MTQIDSEWTILDIEDRARETVANITWIDQEWRSIVTQALASSMQSLETLRVYTQTIVRVLEACDAELAALHELPEVATRLGPDAQEHGFEYIRENIDRLVGDTRAQLALLRVALGEYKLNQVEALSRCADTA